MVRSHYGHPQITNLVGEVRKVANGSNNDVDRALAACGASPMMYRNFDDLSRAAPDPSPAIPNNHEFPLLLEALPELGQVPAASVTSPQPIAPVSEIPSPAPAAAKRLSLFSAPSQAAARGPESDVATKKPMAVPHGDGQAPRKTLSSVFRTLSAAAPARGKTATTATGLQGVFNRL